MGLRVVNVIDVEITKAEVKLKKLSNKAFLTDEACLVYDFLGAKVEVLNDLKKKLRKAKLIQWAKVEVLKDLKKKLRKARLIQ